MNPLSVFIVDDEPLARRRLTLMLRELPEVRLVGESDGGADALGRLAELQPDILLLDIKMPEMDGFELARRLAPQAPPAIIFVTAYDHHALRAWDETGAAAYLLKPVGLGRLRTALARAGVQQRGRDAEERIAELTTILQSLRARAAPEPTPLTEAFWSVARGVRLRTRVDEVVLIDAEGDYVRLHTEDGATVLVRQTLAATADKLDPQAFLRIHRSTIVRRDRVRAVRYANPGAMQLVLDNGIVRAVGRSYLPTVRRTLNVANDTGAIDPGG